MADRPKFRVYVSGEDGKIDFREHEFCALWASVSKGGKHYYTGKTKDGRKVQMWPVEEANGKEKLATAGVREAPAVTADVPF